MPSSVHGFSLFEQARAQTTENIVNTQTIDLLSDSGNQYDEEVFDDIIIENSTLSADSGFDFGSEDGTESITLYTVKTGDTIASVATLFDVSTNTVITANNLKKDTRLVPGTTLVILPMTGVSYTIKKGDTIAGIAKNFNSDIGDILFFNGISGNSELIAGETIIIRGAEIKPLKETKIIKTPVKAKKERLFGTKGPALSGFFIRPIIGGRQSQNLHGYNSIDIAAPKGTPIMASADGTVIKVIASGYGGGYGKYVVITHAGGVQTLYAHMSTVATTTGSTVKQGEIIGYVGSTGRSTGNHLHFEVRGAKNPGSDNTWAR